MKKLLYYFFTIAFSVVFSAGHGQGQAPPEMFNYQGIARDGMGNTLNNQSLGFQISILENNAMGNVVYQEEHSVTSNQFGLFSIHIGDGTAIFGSFTTINWGNAKHYIKVEMDPAGGSLYMDMGTQQLVSVPYALYAGSSPADEDWVKTLNTVYNLSDNVGVGTDTPTEKFEVLGNIKTH